MPSPRAVKGTIENFIACLEKGDRQKGYRRRKAPAGHKPAKDEDDHSGMHVKQAVGRAMRDSKAGTGISSSPTEAVERASKKAAAQAPAKRRTKYLLDGDGGFRQRTDRTAKLQQSFRGKGLCSPR